ncbi:MAG: hypothetical protein Q7J16_12190 [Candidatus Cloacimonadales bacterium]|nr:hypothetical protein [Candidatus Cloacimonadales bacterium]
MQVRIFEGIRSNLEDNINQWLRDHSEVNIVKILQSNQKEMMATVSIWYE